MKISHILISFFLFITNDVISSERPPIDFTSSNLPILVITTSGQTIIDDVKITAHMGVIFNGDGKINNITDPYNDYDGYIGIEIRGYSSSGWSEKKPYGIETRDALGENNNVSLLGLPKENDWVLYAPIADKSLMRNKLVYDLASEMGQYAPRTKFCEVVIDGDYRGVYVLTEKIKQDKNRVDIEEPEATNYSGGYLLELTPEDRVKSDETSFETEETKSFFTVKYPKEDVITSQQTAYIKDFFDEFESVLFSGNLADEINGYVKYIDVPSFIDHILLSECFHQLDGLRSSQYFYKKKNGKLFMGPVWDFNRSLGNVEYYKIYEYDMWWMLNSRGNERVPYVNQLMKDPLFAKQYADQWFELRQGLLHNDNMLSRIDGYADEINEAQTRNFERWPDMLAHSYNQVYTFNSYDQAVQQVKDWLINKMEWLDQGFEDYSTNTYLSNNDFTSFAFEKQTSDFKIEFDWSPQNENMDGVFGLADISSGIDWYTDLACITRFNPDGEIDARNEGAYMNDNAINYTVGEYYHVKMEVDINTHTYDLFVTPSSTDVEIQVAESYGFRSEQSGVEQINGFVMISPSGSYKLKNFCLNEECSIVGVPLIAEKDLPTITSYPNPFTESIHLTLEQKEHLMINLNIYGSDGKLLSQIHNGKLNKGIHEFKWGKNDLNGKELAQGIYFCRFAANGISKTIKIVKIK